MKTSYLVVVGVDGSEGGRRALNWATQEAAARGGAVRAVIAWLWDGIEIGPVVSVSPAVEEEHARGVLQREILAVSEGAGRLPPIAAEVVEGRPAEVLTSAAKDADLLVLGSHGHSRVRHTVLGSVSEACVRRATCPVVVIPAPAPRPVHHIEEESLLSRQGL
jgi:nucleotide-binding universal stress UspA family protein